MDQYSSAPIIASLTALGLTFLFTTPIFLKVFDRVRLRSKGYVYDDVDKLYEDEDGTATEETQKEFSVALPNYLALSSAIVGFLASVTNAVFTTIDPAVSLYTESWLIFGCWVQALSLYVRFMLIDRQSLLLIIIVSVATAHKTATRFDYGRLSAVSSIAIFIALCVRCGASLSNTTDIKGYNILLLVQIGATILCCVSSSLLPRRPFIFSSGQLVDGQYTVSALGRYTFSWAGRILALARHKKTLESEDLSKLHLRARSAHIRKDFESNQKQDHLWRGLITAHYAEILFQFIYAVVESATQFVPQISMYLLLSTIERRTKGNTTPKMAWIFVFTLGLSIIFASWAQAWLYFVSYARMGLLIRTELSAMIFVKATRRKDVKAVNKAKGPAVLGDPSTSNPAEPHAPMAQTTIGKTPETGLDPALAQDMETLDNADEDTQKTRQSTINLIGVDAKRVSDFMIYWAIVPEVLTGLVVSITFLLYLIGWQSLLAGFAVFIVILPVNIFVSKNFSNSQDELMKVRDQKMVLLTEALQGIRQIKFAAEEKQWQAKIGKKRDEELTTQWRVFCLDTALICVWILGPLMLSTVSLAVYALLHGNLSASVAFTTLAVMSNMEGSLAILPEVISEGLEAWVSVKRIDEFLKASERDSYITPGDAINLESLSVAWPSDSHADEPVRFILRDIDLRFPPQELSVISGQTGSGKSLLLAAIIGEAEKLCGAIDVPKPPSVYERHDAKANKSDWIIGNATAFVAQIPWIENATIKDNVLFGLPYDSGRYNKVIRCCALEKDLQMLPDGDLTDIGANGINLSGGQRWRVSFARAMYSRAGILVLDDIFSAVNAHVGRQLFEDALTGELGIGRTRILVTHHIGLVLSRSAYCVILGGGTVQHAGPTEELQRMGVLDNVMKQQQKSDNDETEIAQEVIDDTSNSTLNRILSNTKERSVVFDSSEMDIQGKSQPKKFTEDEKKETGAVKIEMYKEYFSTSGGLWLWLPIMIIFVTHQSIVMGRSWFVGLWTKSFKTESLNIHQLLRQPVAFNSNYVSTEAPSQDLSFYLGIYFGLSFIICISGTLRYFLVYMRAIRASKELFEKLTYAVLRAPLRWLDTTPVGRILNRFTADFAAIDSRLGTDLGFLIYEMILLVSIIIAGLFVSVWMLLFAVTLLMLSTYITSTFLTGAREAKRLESNAKSPIFEQFGSALAGIGTIRAFDKADAYIERMFDKIDAHAGAYWHIWLFNRWLSLRLNWMGAVFAILVAAVIVFQGIEPSLAGFALSFALQYSRAVTWTARNYANVELSMNAVERVNEYSNIPIEDQNSSVKAPAAWPAEGRLEVANLVAGYAPELPPVLKGLSFNVEKNQRIGVVGRTGAGKSSLTLALFRFLEAREGSIHIDGIDISKISLYDLRSRLAIIPQDPVLFSGTVRSNLDPFNNHTNSELYDALSRVHLIHSKGATSHDEPNPTCTTPTPSTPPSSNTNVFQSLTSRISEGGLNLSQGQRQLLCLARAIVSRPKIMVLDEATSAVDMATDILIQRSIREEFQNSTLIVIAHRLSTIVDFDKILVMSDGKQVEFDSPGSLVEREEGVFRGMVEQSGERTRLESVIREEKGKGKGKGKERA